METLVQIGIAAGCIISGLSLLVVCVFIAVRVRRRKQQCKDAVETEDNTRASRPGPGGLPVEPAGDYELNPLDLPPPSRLTSFRGKTDVKDTPGVMTRYHRNSSSSDTPVRERISSSTSLDQQPGIVRQNSWIESDEWHAAARQFSRQSSRLSRPSVKRSRNSESSGSSFRASGPPVSAETFRMGAISRSSFNRGHNELRTDLIPALDESRSVAIIPRASIDLVPRESFKEEYRSPPTFALDGIISSSITHKGFKRNDVHEQSLQYFGQSGRNDNDRMLMSSTMKEEVDTSFL